MIGFMFLNRRYIINATKYSANHWVCMFIHHYFMESYSKFEMAVHFTTYISLHLAPVLDVDQIIFSG